MSAYIFGDVLNGADPLDNVRVAVAINLAPEEVPCGSSPHGTQWLADQLRLKRRLRTGQVSPISSNVYLHWLDTSHGFDLVNETGTSPMRHVRMPEHLEGRP